MQNPKNGIKFDADFAKTMMGFDSNLEKALEAALTEQEKAPIQTAIDLNKKSSIPQQILAFVGVLGNMFSAFIKIGDSFNNPIAIIKLKVAMIVLKKNLKELVTTIVDAFNGIDVSKLSDVMKVLVSDPEVTTNTLINHTKNSIEKDTKNSTDAFSKNISVTQKGKQGLIDVITNVMNIFQLLNSLNFPNVLTFRVKMKRSMRQLNIMWKELGKFISSNKFDESKIDAMNKSFEGLIETYMSIKNIVESVNEIGGLGNLKNVYLAKLSIGLIFDPNPKAKTKSIFVILTKAINSKSFEAFASEDTTKKLQQFQKNIKIISNVATNLALIGLLTVPLLLAYAGVLLLKGLVWLIFKLFDKDTIDAMNEAQEGIVKLSLVIVALSMSVVLLALTGLLIIESWEVMGMVMLYLVAVTAIFFVISLIVKFMDKIDATQSILYIAAAIGILALTVILLSLAGKLITEEWDNIWKVALYLGVLVAAFLLLSIASIWIKEGSKTILYLALSVAILVVLIYALIPVSYLVEENRDKLLMTMALLGCLVAAVIGIAFAGTLVKAGTAVLIALGVSLMLVVGSLLILVYTAEKIKELDLKEDEAKKILVTPLKMMWGAISYAASLKTSTLLKGVAKIVALGAASLSISNMAYTIQKFAELKMPTKFDKNGKAIEFRPMSKDDFENAARNIQKILKYVLETISDDDITATLESLSKKAIKNIGLIMDNTAGVTNLIEAIEKSVKFDDKTIEKGVGNVKSLISKYIIALRSLFVGTGNVKEEEGWFGKKSYKLEITGAPEIDIEKLKTIVKSVESLKKTLEPISEVMQMIDEMPKLTEKDASNIGKVIQANIESVFGDKDGKGGIQVNSNSIQKISALESVIDQEERFAKLNTSNVQKNTDNFIKFIDKANSIDTDKIKSVRDMFEQMARFSESIQGDFEKLADVLSEKLVDILDKLNTTIENVQGLPANGNTTPAAATSASASVAVTSDMVKTDKPEKQNQAIERLIGYVDGIEDALEKLNQSINSYHNTGIRTTI